MTRRRLRLPIRRLTPANVFAALAFAALGPLSAGASFAQAQAPARPKLSATETREANKHAALGAKLFAEGMYEAAIPELAKAYEALRRPQDLERLAQSYDKSGEYDRALDAYDKLVAETMPRGPLPATKKAMDDLAAKVGSLAIKVSVEGAKVAVDDRALGVTPLAKNERLNVGAHHITIAKDGFEDWEKDVTVAPRQTVTVDAALEPRVMTGHLAVREKSGGDVRVFIDGKDVGPAPWEGDVAPGEHQVELKGLKMTAASKPVKVERRGRAELVLEGSTVVSTVRIETVPRDARLRVDGARAAAPWQDDLPPGDYAVEAWAPGYETSRRVVHVDAGAPLSLQIALKKLGPSPADLQRQTEAARVDAERGVYGNVSLFGAYPLHAYAKQDCDPVASQCTSGFPLGGGAALRGGYSWGVVGVEVVGAFLFDRHQDGFTYNGSATTATAVEKVQTHDETFSYQSFGGFFGVGPRVATRGRMLHFTIGAAGGVAVRAFSLERALTGGVRDTVDASDSYVAPAATADLGLVIGATPGIRVYAGAMGWMDFPSSTIASAPLTRTATLSAGGNLLYSVPSYPIVNSSQIYIGPVVGVFFGH